MAAKPPVAAVAKLPDRPQDPDLRKLADGAVASIRANRPRGSAKPSAPVDTAKSNSAKKAWKTRRGGGSSAAASGKDKATTAAEDRARKIAREDAADADREANKRRQAAAERAKLAAERRKVELARASIPPAGTAPSPQRFASLGQLVATGQATDDDWTEWASEGVGLGKLDPDRVLAAMPESARSKASERITAARKPDKAKLRTLMDRVQSGVATSDEVTEATAHAIALGEMSLADLAQMGNYRAGVLQRLRTFGKALRSDTLEAKTMDWIDTNGSLEQTVTDLDDAFAQFVQATLPDEPLVTWVEATYAPDGDQPGQFIAGIGELGSDGVEFVQVDYRIDADDTIRLGEPRELAVVGVTPDVYATEGEVEFLPAEKVLAGALAFKNMTSRRRRLLVLASMGRSIDGAPYADTVGSAVGGGRVSSPSSPHAFDPPGSLDSGDMIAGGGHAFDGLSSIEETGQGMNSRNAQPVAWRSGTYYLDAAGNITGPAVPASVNQGVYRKSAEPGRKRRGTVAQRLREVAGTPRTTSDTPMVTQSGGEAKTLDKVIGAAAGLLAEVKAGRVLNGANASRITAAWDALGEVLAEAGLLGDGMESEDNDADEMREGEGYGDPAAAVGELSMKTAKAASFEDDVTEYLRTVNRTRGAAV